MYHHDHIKHTVTLSTVSKKYTPATLREARPIMIHTLSFLGETREGIDAIRLFANAKVSFKGTQPLPTIEQIFCGCTDQALKFPDHIVYPGREWKLFRINLDVQAIKLHFVRHDSLIPPRLQYPSGCCAQENYVVPQIAIVTITAPSENTACPKGFDNFKCSFHAKTVNPGIKTHETYHFSSYYRPSDRCQEIQLSGVIDTFSDNKPHFRTEVKVKDHG